MLTGVQETGNTISTRSVTSGIVPSVFRPERRGSICSNFFAGPEPARGLQDNAEDSLPLTAQGHRECKAGSGRQLRIICVSRYQAHWQARGSGRGQYFHSPSGWPLRFGA